MPERNLVVIIRSPPHSTLNWFEGLRAAAGLTDHHLKILWIGDGVDAALGSVDQRMASTILGDLPSLCEGMYVDSESLKVRGLEKAPLLESVKSLNRAEVDALLTEAEATLAF